eukprot:4543812-Pyramimonas_sp.AAC.1
MGCGWPDQCRVWFSRKPRMRGNTSDHVAKFCWQDASPREAPNAWEDPRLTLPCFAEYQPDIVISTVFEDPNAISLLGNHVE